MAIVKQRYESMQAGKPYPTPSGTCWPMVPPLIFRVREMQLVQNKDHVTLIYMQDHEVRRVRIGGAHPANLTPTWHGDSIGHYEGDTLVVDTVGIKPGKWPVLDRYGTPRSDALHVIERYRLIDGQAAEDAMLAHHRTFTRAPTGKADGYGGVFDSDMSRKGLQVTVTVEDPKMFRKPYTGLVTYRPESNWPEMICADPPSLSNTTLLEIGGPLRQNPVALKADF